LELLVGDVDAVEVGGLRLTSAPQGRAKIAASIPTQVLRSGANRY
jgi:hypothetical protein